MDFVSNFIYLSKVNDECTMSFSFSLQKKSALESKYMWMHTMYIDLVVGEGTTLLIKTLEINYKYQLKSYLVQKSNLNSTWDLTYQVLHVLIFFHETITIKLLTSAFWSIKEWLAKFFVYHSIVCFKPT